MGRELAAGGPGRSAAMGGGACKAAWLLQPRGRAGVRSVAGGLAGAGPAAGVGGAPTRLRREPAGCAGRTVPPCEGTPWTRRASAPAPRAPAGIAPGSPNGAAKGCAALEASPAVSPSVPALRGRPPAEFGIGLAGLGDIANTHLEAYRRRGFRVVAGADVDPRRAEAARARWGLPRVFSGPEAVAQLCRLPEVDVVDITVPHYRELRLPVVQTVAAAGKPMQVQKPMAQSYGEALELVETAERAGVPFRVNQNSVFVPAFTALHGYLRDGAIGRPYYYQIENRGLWASEHPHFGTRPRWIISDMGVHHYALAQHWFGAPETVAALGARDPSQPRLVGENLGVLALRYAGGLQGLVINNWSYRGSRGRAHAHEEIVIQGDNGAITAHSGEVEVTTLRPAARTFPQFHGEWFPEAFGHSMHEFLTALAQGRPPLCHGRDNLQVMAAIEAAYRSIAEGGRPVPLAEITRGG